MKTCQYFEVKVNQVTPIFFYESYLTLPRLACMFRDTHGEGLSRRGVSEARPDELSASSPLTIGRPSSGKAQQISHIMSRLSFSWRCSLLLSSILSISRFVPFLDPFPYPAKEGCSSQTLLWMEPEHPFVIARLAGVFLCALPAVRELYQYVANPKYV